MTIAPHGGALVDRHEYCQSDRELAGRLSALPVIPLGAVELSDLELIADGGFSPLPGFMGRRDYESVVETMRLGSGLPWSIPVTLSLSHDKARELSAGKNAALATEGGVLLGEMEVQEIYPWDREKEASMVYGTNDESHPGVARLAGMGEYLVAGPVTLFRPVPHDDFRELRLSHVRRGNISGKRDGSG